MSETVSAVKVPAEQVGDAELSLYSLLLALSRHKALIILLSLVAAIVAAAISLTMPNLYKSAVRLLPPQQARSGAEGLLSQLGGLPGGAGALAGLKNPNDLYLGILRSRTIGDQIIKQFDLGKVYDIKSLDKVRKQLAQNLFVASGKDGLITVEVVDEDPKRAAEMANAYVAALMKLTSTLAVTEASKRRLFFESQLEGAKNKLAMAEMTLKSGLDTHGVISVDSDSRAVVENVGRVRAQVSAKEIQLGAMEPFVTKTNPDYRRVLEELNSLRAELSNLENGRSDTRASNGRGADRRAGLDNIKILRDVKYYQMLYELLAKQYEAARLDEAKDNSLIQVLDSAVAPEFKFKPARAVIVLFTGALAFFFACLLAILIEVKANLLLLPENAARWANLKRNLLSRSA